MNRIDPSKQINQSLIRTPPPRYRRNRPWLTLIALGGGGLLLLGIVFAAGVYVAGGIGRGVDDVPGRGADPEVVQAGSSDSEAGDDGAFQTPGAELDTARGHPDQPDTDNDQNLNFGQFYWTHASGGIKVFGELWNEGNQDLSAIEIIVALRDEAGEALASETAPVHLGIIRANQMTPFQVVLPDATDEFARLHLEAFGDPFINDSDGEGRRYELLEVVGGEWHVEDNARRITGEVHNSGDRPCELINVIAAGYSADGTLQFVEWTFANIEVLEPGDSVPFEIPIFEPDFDEPTELRVYVQSWEVIR